MLGLTRGLPINSLLWRGATLFLSNGIGQALAFLASIAIARILGVHSFGLYAALMAVVFVLGLLVEAGLETTLAREVAADPGTSVELLKSSIAIKLWLGGAISLVLALPPVASVLAPDPSVQLAVQLLGPLITLSAINASFGAVFRALGRTAYVLLINVAGMGLQLIGTLAILIAFKSLTLIFAWMILVQAFELFLGFVLFNRHVPHSESHVHLQSNSSLLKRSWPFALAGVLGAFTLRIDLFIIEAVKGAAQVGVYSAGTRLNDLMALAPNSFFAVLLPAMAAQQGIAAAGGGGEGQVYGLAVRRMALAGAVLAVVGLLFADLLVWVFFGPAFADAALPLRILLVSLVPLLVNRTTTVHLYASHREHRANFALVLNLVQRALLGVLLVPVWGAAGAALAGLEAECGILVFYSMTGAMGKGGLRGVARRVMRKLLGLRFRGFKPGAQPDHIVRVAGLKLTVNESVFDPKLHFTSAYLARYLRQPGVVSEGSNVLDIGTGSGIAAISAALSGAGKVIATDINPAAVSSATENAGHLNVSHRLITLQGDMFEPVGAERFDLIISNPPYLRGNAANVAERAYMGGADLEWFNRFATEASEHLTPNGKVLMVLGDIAETDYILQKFRDTGWVVTVAAHRDLIVEGLYIYELRLGT